MDRISFIRAAASIIRNNRNSSIDTCGCRRRDARCYVEYPCVYAKQAGTYLQKTLVTLAVIRSKHLAVAWQQIFCSLCKRTNTRASSASTLSLNPDRNNVCKQYQTKTLRIFYILFLCLLTMSRTAVRGRNFAPCTHRRRTQDTYHSCVGTPTSHFHTYDQRPQIGRMKTILSVIYK